MAIRIALVHNHFLVRKGIKALISGTNEFELVGEFETINQISEQGIAGVDVVVFNFKDIESGISAMPHYQSYFPGARYLSISYLPSRFEVSEGIQGCKHTGDLASSA